jgi:serine/threonine-protein kinase
MIVGWGHSQTSMTALRQFLTELRRRRVIRVLLLYAIAGWVVIQVASTVLPNLHVPAWSVTLVTVLVALGLPLAAVLAWAFDVGDDGLKRTAPARTEVDTAGALPEASVQPVPASVPATPPVVAGAAVHPSRRALGSVPEEAAIDSLAVLPFKPLLAGERDEPLELGIADALITTLSNSTRIPVRPISAVRAYSDPAQDPVSAARELAVAAVLDGSIQRSRDQIRVSARLTRSGDGATLWADRYTERMTDIFGLQDAIAERIAAALEWKLDAGQRARLTKRYTDSVDAYEAYLHGRYNWSKPTWEGLWKAIDFFRRAIAADGNYALAYVGLADAYTSLDWYGMLSTRESNPHALAAAERALAIDGDLAEAHAALAVAKQNRWDWAGADAAYRRALELSPTQAESHQRYGTYLSFMGRCEEGLAHLKRAHQLNPVSHSISAQIALSLLCARRYEEAIAQCSRTLDAEPACDEARVYLMLSYVQTGTPAAAVAEYERMTPTAGDTTDVRAMLAYAQALAGNKPEARTILAELLHLSRSRYVPHFWLAMVHVGLGNYPEALACLERACEDPDDSLVAIKVVPFLDPIRREPRFTEVLRKMGLENH